MYFNVARGLYLQADNIYANLILIPTIVAGKITMGIWQQILTAFGQVSSSFQFLVNSWTTIVELMSIYKRLRAFEAVFKGRELSRYDREFLEGKGEYAVPTPEPEPGRGRAQACARLRALTAPASGCATLTHFSAIGSMASLPSGISASHCVQ